VLYQLTILELTLHSKHPDVQGRVRGVNYVHFLYRVKFDKSRQLVHYLDRVVLYIFEGRQAIPQLLV
jgi:hypothetical protein